MGTYQKYTNQGKIYVIWNVIENKYTASTSQT